MRHSLAVILLLGLTGCGLFSPLPTGMPGDAAQDNGVTAEQLYAEAQEAEQDKSYEKAVKVLEQLQARYPYGRYAQQAQMEIAYTYYKQGESEAALGAIDRFMKYYPNSAHMDYVLYLQGLINFNSDLGLFGGFFQQDLAERDQKAAQDSYAAFHDLVQRFPASKYVPDARIRMQYLINTLARSEIHVADYYLRRGAYLAAANRAKTVLTTYPNSPQTRDALRVLVVAYDAMGMNDLRDDAKRVLQANGEDPEKIQLASTSKDRPWWRFWK
jgi:outer membrane protein assembly factor BamD